MQKKICIAQSVEELKFILEKSGEKILVLPVNLETFLYCVSKNLNFINPKKIISNDIHKKILIETDDLIKKIIFSSNLDSNLLHEIQVFLRFRVYSFKFIKYSIEKILKKEANIKYFIVSGWSKDTHFNLNEYILSEIVQFLIPKNKIINLNDKTLKKVDLSKNNIFYEYIEPQLKSYSKKNKILLNNLYYNFKRIIFSNFSRKNVFFYPTFSKVGAIRRTVFYFFNIKPLFFKKKQTKIKFKNFYSLRKISKTYEYKILKLFSNKFENYFIDLYQKNKSIKKLLENNHFDLIAANITKGIEGAVMCKTKNKQTNSVCIPHGTITNSFNKFDKIYKKNIAQAVFSGDANYFSIQSKITKKSLKNIKINGKPITTGNIVFASNNNSSKQKILFAVTLKDFYNLQFLGVEMFYEFYENLKTFEEISQKNEFKFLVKIHPSEQKCAAQLQSFFKNLEFTSKKIDHALRDAFVTISYSSTVIEDSLNSSVPVILFDQWNRYQHCEAERNIQKLNKAIYYVKKKEDLAKTLKTVLRSKKIDFKQYILDKDYNSNIKKFILPKAELKI